MIVPEKSSNHISLNGNFDVWKALTTMLYQNFKVSIIVCEHTLALSTAFLTCGNNNDTHTDICTGLVGL